jgi:hypothetical protein
MVVEYCRAAPTLKVAIRRAVLSKDAAGKHHNHQSKIVATAYTPMLNALLHKEVRLQRAHDFDAIHDIVEAYAVPGWGPVGIYDIATRIAAFLGLEPQSLYLHAGVRQGWYALCEALPDVIFNRRAWANVERVTREHLPAEFLTLSADEVEDFLCTYRSVFGECLARKESA